MTAIVLGDGFRGRRRAKDASPLTAPRSRRWTVRTQMHRAHVDQKTYVPRSPSVFVTGPTSFAPHIDIIGRKSLLVFTAAPYDCGNRCDHDPQIRLCVAAAAAIPYDRALCGPNDIALLNFDGASVHAQYGPRAEAQKLALAW